MYGIKLVTPAHLEYECFTEEFDGADGRRTLMNFSSEGNGPATAANIPVGHRSIVYVTRLGKFIWAIEFIGTVEDGERAAKAHIRERSLSSEPSKWSIYRPIRFLAKVNIDEAPNAAEIERKTGLCFKPNSFTLKYISGDGYEAIFGAIKWTWVARKRWL
jgi:hypothetical protein